MPQTYDNGDESRNLLFQAPQGQRADEQSVGQVPARTDHVDAPPGWQASPQSAPPPQQARPAYQPPADAAAADAVSQQAAPHIVYAAAPQKKSHGWIVALVAIICLFAFSALCVKSCTDLVSGGAHGAYFNGPTGDAIAVIDLDGTIQYDKSACSPEGLKELLDRATENDHVKAVVLRVNSGGGTASAGEEMAEYVRRFGKPVVVSSASINASAAYEISSQADYIYVAKSTEIGAIGTAMELTDISGLLDMLGIDVDVITSADSKDSSYGYRPLSDDEREYYQHMIDQINDIFIENVATGRDMSVDDVRELATGLSFTGVDAIGNGLADEVGTLEDAMAKAAELAGVEAYVRYDLGFSSYDLAGLYSLFGSGQQEQAIRLDGTPVVIGD